MMSAPAMAFEESWITLSLLAAFASVIVAIIFIMVSRLFNNPKLEQTAKSEFVFAASTVFLTIFAITVVVLAQDIAVQYVDEIYGNFLQQNVPHATITDILIAYLNKVQTCSVNFLRALYTIDVFVQTVLSVTMEVIMSDLATGFFMNFFSDRIVNSTQVISFYMIIYNVIYNILIFLKHFGMYFFTFGIILRAFPPSRGAGAFIMSLSIGLYFIFPLSYILIGVTMQEAGGPVICDITSLPAVENCKTDANGQLVCSTSGAFDVKKVFKQSLNLKVSTNAITRLLEQVGSFMNNLTMTMCLLPLLALTVTLSFILSTSSLFGATIPEVGKGLVKLI